MRDHRIKHELLRSLKISPGLPVILQQNPMECGLACVAMLVAYYGHPVEMSQLRQLARPGEFGLSVRGVLSAFATLGHKAMPFASSPEDLYELTDPCIVHMRHGHYMILKRLSSARAIVHDPASGFRKLASKEFCSNYSGGAIAMFPAEGQAPQSSRLINLRFHQE